MLGIRLMSSKMALPIILKILQLLPWLMRIFFYENFTNTQFEKVSIAHLTRTTKLALSENMKIT